MTFTEWKRNEWTKLSWDIILSINFIIRIRNVCFGSKVVKNFVKWEFNVT